MKALKTHCPPFKDYDGKFLRSCVQKDLQIYIFTFKTTATFTDCHTNKKYHAQIHVERAMERAMERIKNYHIFDRTLPASLNNIAEQMFFVCAVLTNFWPPLCT